MQPQSLLLALSLTIAAFAAPAPNPSSTSALTPGQGAQNQCSEGQVATCCNSITNGVGAGCTVLNRTAPPPSLLPLYFNQAQYFSEELELTGGVHPSSGIACTGHIPVLWTASTRLL